MCFRIFTLLGFLFQSFISSKAFQWTMADEGQQMKRSDCQKEWELHYLFKYKFSGCSRIQWSKPKVKISWQFCTRESFDSRKKTPNCHCRGEGCLQILINCVSKKLQPEIYYNLSALTSFKELPCHNVSNLHYTVFMYISSFSTNNNLITLQDGKD